MEKFNCQSMIQRCNGDCCGIIPMDKDFLKRFENKAQTKPIKVLGFSDSKIIVETKDNRCIFQNRETKECAIYENRPQTCRDYGKIPELQCVFFDMKGNKRSPAKIRRMERFLAKDQRMKIRHIKMMIRKEEVKNAK